MGWDRSAQFFKLSNSNFGATDIITANMTTGNIGIGIDPAYPLHVARDSNTCNIIAERTGTGASRAIMQGGNESVFFGSLSSDTTHIGVGGIASITIDTSHNIQLNGTDIFRNTSTSVTQLGGDTANNLGGALLVYGGSHPTVANDFVLKSAATWVWHGDASVSALKSAWKIWGASGSAAEPGYAFSADTDTGMFSLGTNTIGFSTNGTTRFRIQNTGVATEDFGTAAQPAYHFAGDDNTGLYRSAADRVAVSVGGNRRFEVGALTAANNTGVWIPSGPVVGLSVGSDASGITLTNSTLKSGRVGCPHYTSAEEQMAVMHFYSDASDSIVNIGGGSSIMNASTKINFYTAGNTTTVTGTARWSMSNNEFVGESGQTIRRGS
jgi:hypothetical protein